MGLTQLAIYVLLAMPFIGVIGFAYWMLLGKDLNGLILIRPFEFWVFVGIAMLLEAPTRFLRRGSFCVGWSPCLFYCSSRK